MRCPYCLSQMRPCERTQHRSTTGVRVAQWARCTGCEHATIVATHSFNHSLTSKQQLTAVQACA